MAEDCEQIIVIKTTGINQAVTITGMIFGIMDDKGNES